MKTLTLSVLILSFGLLAGCDARARALLPMWVTILMKW